MADTGFKVATAFATVTRTSSKGDWDISNAPDMITASTSGAGYTNWAKLTGYGFSLPSNAAVDGIEVKYDGNSGDGLGTDGAVYMLKAGSQVGTNGSVATNWNGAAQIDHGGATSKWGTTWLYSDINNSGFGFEVSAYANGADSFSFTDGFYGIKVFYHLSSASFSAKVGIKSTRMKGISKTAKIALLGIISKVSKNFTKVCKLKMGLLASRVRSLTKNSIIKPLLGEKVSRAKLLSKLKSYAALIGIKSIENIKVSKMFAALIGILASRSRKLTKASIIKPLLGIKPFRSKSIVKVPKSVLLGELSSRTAKRGWLRSTIAKLASSAQFSRRISFVRSLLPKIGALAIRSYSVPGKYYNYFNAYLGNLVSMSRTIKAFRSFVSLLASSIFQRHGAGKIYPLIIGISSTFSRQVAMVRIIKPLLGLLSKISRGIAVQRAIKVLLGIKSQIGRIISVARPLSSVLGIVPMKSAIKGLSRAFDTAIGMFSKVRNFGWDYVKDFVIKMSVRSNIYRIFTHFGLLILNTKRVKRTMIFVNPEKTIKFFNT